VFSFIFSFTRVDDWFGGGAGGSYGYFVISWLKNMIGPFGAGSIVFILLVVWMILVNGKIIDAFFGWVDRVTAPKPKKVEEEVVELPQESDGPVGNLYADLDAAVPATCEEEDEKTLAPAFEIIGGEVAQDEDTLQENVQQEEKKEKKSFLKKDPKKEKIAQLEAQVTELTEKLAKEKDGYLRLMAEFDNFRRRTSQEKLELVSMASTDTIKGLLPVLDDCERALNVLKESSDSEAAKEGTELIYHKLMSYLQSKGLAVIEAAGQPFDTDLHEAVAQFPVQEEEQKGKVFDVVQTGYTLNGKVIRFAKVVVGI
jgi:molecular chaperone GrpE